MCTKRIDELETRQQELLITIRKLSAEMPYAEESSNAAVLIAEVGTLKARVAELERVNDRLVEAIALDIEAHGKSAHGNNDDYDLWAKALARRIRAVNPSR